MIDTFESTARTIPDQVFFTFVDETGAEVAYTYRQTRLIAATFARYIASRGIAPGDVVVLDLPNSPELVFLLMAAAYGSFTVLIMDQSLSESDKLLRLYDVRRDGSNVVCTITPHIAAELLVFARDLLGEDGDVMQGLNAIIAAREQEATLQRPSVSTPAGEPRGRNSGPLPRLNNKRNSGPLPRTAPSERPSVSTPLGEGGLARTSRPIMGEQQDAIADAVHYAEREAHLFNPDLRAVILFAPAAAGKVKAVPLTWSQLSLSAQNACAALMTYGEGLWQAVMPFSDISGLSILVRSVQNRSPLRIYEIFSPHRVLADCESRHATHIAVTDFMLQDMLGIEEARASESLTNAHLLFAQAVEAGMFTTEEAMRMAAERVRPTAAILSRLAIYDVILIIDNPLNPETVERALSQSAPVYATYSATEVSGLAAATYITPDFTGGLQLLGGYSARIIDPDPKGFGRLALLGPGVFDGYLNARAAFTVDGYFLTGDVAALHNGRIYVLDRDSASYAQATTFSRPNELAEVLADAPGITDAYVFNAGNGQGQRGRIAVVERGDDQLSAEGVYAYLSANVPTMDPPASIAFIDEMPRRMGVINGDRVEALWDQRLDVRRVVLHWARLPLRQAVRFGPVRQEHRSCIVVEVIDGMGRHGLGECMSAEGMQNDEEALVESAKYLQDELVPALVGRPLLHPRDAARLFALLPGAEGHPLACTALETALWDLHGRIVRRPFWSLLNEEYERVRRALGDEAADELPRAAHIEGSKALVSSSRSMGVGSIERTAAAARKASEAGYRRLKLRITPETKLASLRVAMDEFEPGGIVTFDANRTFTEREGEKLQALDSLRAAWIEEPLDPAGLYEGRRSPIAQVAALQRKLATPLAVDESYVSLGAAERILQFVDLRLICMKIGKFGGIEAALRFLVKAQSQGRDIVVGAPFSTGIGKRMAAAFETLPGIIQPGDIDMPTLVYETDLAWPPYRVVRGYATLNEGEMGCGLGCELDPDALEGILVKRTTIE